MDSDEWQYDHPFATEPLEHPGCVQDSGTASFKFPPFDLAAFTIMLESEPLPEPIHSELMADEYLRNILGV